ncbi:MAG: hypothetical protein ACP5G6_08675, partial [Conexivisphaera sp.]
VVEARATAQQRSYARSHVAAIFRAADFRSAGVGLVVDTRRVYDPLEFRARGVRLVQLGRAPNIGYGKL